MTDGGDFSWNRLMQWRSECYAKFGSVLNLPIRTPRVQLDGILGPHGRVLDVGAGAHKPFEKVITATGSSYYSMDTDPLGTFNFRSFADVPDNLRFDTVIANQVLEHLSVEAAFSIVASAFERIRNGGHFLATVPNAAHPVRQWDCTHITAWPANDLYSLMRSAGFEVIAMSRYNKLPFTSNPIKRWIINIVSREFRMDWCDSIMAVGLKPDANSFLNE
jgi:hypothetical protein